MLIEKGTVEKVLGNKALVKIGRSSACSTCESRSSCHVEGDKKIVIEVKNTLGAGEGETVELSMPTGSVLKASAAVYILPVLGLMLGAFLGKVFSGLLALGFTASAIAGGAAGLGLSIAVLIYFDRSVRSRPEYHPQMKRIIGESKEVLPCGDNR
jgi:sigma-E factor negative regulatory protein RseC